MFLLEGTSSRRGVCDPLHDACNCYIDILRITIGMLDVNSAILLTSLIEVISAGQMRAARALLAIDQRQLAELCGLSVPTIQRMEASDSVVRGNVDSLMKVVAALDQAGIELIGEGAISQSGGRGVRLKTPPAVPEV